MITNERQYRISRAQLSRLRKAAHAFDLKQAVERAGSEVLAKAELEALRSEERVLAAQVREYEELKSGTLTALTAQNLDELPKILIQARIAQSLSQLQLADMLHLKEQQIQRYESENYASASLTRLVQVANALRLNISEVADLRQEYLSRPRSRVRNLGWSRFPVKEMYRRNFFTGFSGSLAAAMAERESLAKDFVTSVIREPLVALTRQRVRSGSAADPYALLAWECRVLRLAQQSGPTSRYAQGSLTNEWLLELVRQSRFDNGPRRAKEYLEKAGISLVIEPHLSNTHLDGAALLHGRTPIVGLTLRYDRLDNFWFVLVHELVHISKHLRRGLLENIFDDMDNIPAERDKTEREADSLAGEALIPNPIWETALARYVRTEDSITSLAKQLRIHPAIIAGRIRNEADSYVILNELVGQSQVRKHFREVNFAQ